MQLSENPTNSNLHNLIRSIENSAAPRIGPTGLLKQPHLSQLELYNPEDRSSISLAPSLQLEPLPTIPWIREAHINESPVHYPLLTIATPMIQNYRQQGYTRGDAVQAAARSIAPVIETKYDMYEKRQTNYTHTLTTTIGKSAPPTTLGSQCHRCQAWVTCTHPLAITDGIDSQIVAWDTAYRIARRHKTTKAPTPITEYNLQRQTNLRQKIILALPDTIEDYNKSSTIQIKLCYACWACSHVPLSTDKSRLQALHTDCDHLTHLQNIPRCVRGLVEFVGRHPVDQPAYQNYYSPLTDAHPLDHPHNSAKTSITSRTLQDQINKRYYHIQQATKLYITTALTATKTNHRHHLHRFKYTEHQDDAILDPRDLVGTTYSINDQDYKIYTTAVKHTSLTSNGTSTAQQHLTLFALLAPTQSVNHLNELQGTNINLLDCRPYGSLYLHNAD